MFLMFAGAFLGLYATHPVKRSALWISFSYVAACGAFVIDFFRDSLPDILSTHGSNGLYMLTAVLFVIGITRKYQAKTPWAFLAVATFANMAAFMTFYYVVPDMVLRSIGVNIGNGVIFSLGLFAIRSNLKQWIDKLIFVGYAGMCLQLFIRPFVVRFYAPETLTLETYSSSVFYTSLHLVVGLFALTVGMSLLVSYCLNIFSDLRNRSETDSLSGILNRRGLEEQSLPLTHKADATGNPMCILLADIDNFKRINDTYGHAFGDNVIARMGTIFQQYQTGDNIACRMGGEEFALVLPDMSLKEAREIADDLRLSFANAMFAGAAADESFTASFGVIQRQRCEPLLKAISRADEALYVSKKKGRNRVTCETDAAVGQLRDAADTMANPLERRANRPEEPTSKTG
jgi:diguanylate cyclase (GGDEF)-like protein